MSLTLSWANQSNVAFCRQIDSLAPAEVLAGKIERGEILLAFQDQRPIGYLRLEYLWLKLPFIGLIEVEKDARGRGIGRQMLEFLEKELRSRGYDRLLSSVLPDAEQARNWHENNGFATCGRLENVNPDGQGEIFLLKHLSSGTEESQENGR